MKLNSYILLQQISNSLFENLKSEDEILSRLENKKNAIADAVCNDFFVITNKRLIIDELFFYYENVSYRQGATALLLKSHFQSNSDVIIRFECLIDFNRILLKIKSLSGICSSEVISMIEKKYNVEGLTELKDLL